MENKKMNLFVKIYIVIIFVVIFIMLIGLYTPLIGGKAGVVQVLMKFGGITTLFILVDILILILYKKSGEKLEKDSILALIVLLLFSFLGMYFSYDSIKALGSEPKEVISYNYSVKRDIVKLSRDRLLLSIELEDDKTLDVEITKSMYKELKQAERPIKITYYPYVNIINKLEYIE